ncbi:hypothetical protein FNT36_02310 [Hymenobacter setariae]|uniref:Outer membrane protein beta-barrel domain-containing protein n=1 Tax=Hymenobacter setariae TaxID=2594794 RepID=A0A558C2J6_9BACT|nr:hypothetical protein [Hymenobacter setariae]TVT42946.1 hypothetical protein FNT36_02310 [Hymenobacter setariae]
MKNKYAWLLAVSLSGAGPVARAQQVLLHTDVARDTLAPRTGPNRRYFGHFYIGYGLVLGGSSAGLPLRYGAGSSEVQLGARLKRRFTDNLALTADLRYAYLRYALAQDAGPKAPPFGPPHDAETLTYHQLQGEVGLRFNTGFRPRGNVVGTYLDLLAYGGPALGANHTTIDETTTQGRLEITRHEPPYLQRWLGGVGLRLGSGPLALVGHYRLSEALRPAEGGAPLQPPRCVLGLEIGWF